MNFAMLVVLIATVLFSFICMILTAVGSNSVKNSIDSCDKDDLERARKYVSLSSVLLGIIFVVSTVAVFIYILIERRKAGKGI